MRMLRNLMAVGMLALSSPSHATPPTPVDASLAELAPTSEQVIAYLLKDGPPKPERRFRGLPAVDREGLRFGAFENVECTEKSRYQGRPYWRCFYSMTAFTRAGTKLTSRGWEILGHDDKGGLRPIMLQVVAAVPPSSGKGSSPGQPPSPLLNAKGLAQLITVPEEEELESFLVQRNRKALTAVPSQSCDPKVPSCAEAVERIAQRYAPMMTSIYMSKAQDRATEIFSSTMSEPETRATLDFFRSDAGRAFLRSLSQVFVLKKNAGSSLNQVDRDQILFAAVLSQEVQMRKEFQDATGDLPRAPSAALPPIKLQAPSAPHQ